MARFTEELKVIVYKKCWWTTLIQIRVVFTYKVVYFAWIIYLDLILWFSIWFFINCLSTILSLCGNTLLAEISKEVSKACKTLQDNSQISYQGRFTALQRVGEHKSAIISIAMTILLRNNLYTVFIFLYIYFKYSSFYGLLCLLDPCLTVLFNLRLCLFNS